MNSAHLPAGDASRHLRCSSPCRADFVSQALTYRPLADALQRGGIVLGPIARAALRRVIESQAHNRGVTYEPGLVERLLDDVGEEPGNLPLLQFALSELWVRAQSAIRLPIIHTMKLGEFPARWPAMPIKSIRN
ncbi:MAG: hypothetical protein V9G24_16395 [Rhodoblastus sp.]